MIIGTMVVIMSFGSTALGSSITSANSAAKWCSTDVADKDLLDALNQSFEEELYESLYGGKSLYDIATAQGGDIESVIDLQMTQLGRQLDDRLRSGSISAEQDVAHKKELRDIVEQSVFTSFGIQEGTYRM